MAVKGAIINLAPGIPVHIEWILNICKKTVFYFHPGSAPDGSQIDPGDAFHKLRMAYVVIASVNRDSFQRVAKPQVGQRRVVLVKAEGRIGVICAVLDNPVVVVGPDGFTQALPDAVVIPCRADYWPVVAQSFEGHRAVELDVSRGRGGGVFKNGPPLPPLSPSCNRPDPIRNKWCHPQKQRGVAQASPDNQ